MRRAVRAILPYATRTVVSLLVVIVGIMIARWLVNTRPAVREVPDRDSRLRVQTMELARVPIRRVWSGFGSIEASRVADVAAEVTGVIAEIPDGIDAGARINADEVLARIDPADFEYERTVAQRTVDRLRAQLDSLDIAEGSIRRQIELVEQETQIARDEFERAVESFDRDGASPSEVARRQRELRAAERIETDLRERLDQVGPRRAELQAQLGLEEARLGLASRNFERSTIRSPIAGTLQSLVVEPGERVAPGTPIARVVDLSRVEAPLRFPATARSSISAGNSVQMSLETTASKIWQATITRVEPESDPSSRTFAAYADVDQNPNDRFVLAPGQFVKAEVMVSEPVDRLIAPRRAILNDQVFVVTAEGLVERRRAVVDYFFVDSFPRFGVSDDEWAALDPASNLEPGDRLILTNLDELEPGTVVDATPAALVEAPDLEPESSASRRGDESIGG